MKGVILTFRKKNKPNKNSPVRLKRKGCRGFELKYIFKRYGCVIFFVFILTVGLTVGCVAEGKVSSDTLSRLDLLFAANLPQRLENGALGAFCAGFASNFLFLFSAFLSGLSLWGMALLPLIAFFKGFGVGISAGYLFSCYGLKGVGFYLGIILPGTFLFSIVLAYQLTSSYNICRRLILSLFSKNNNYPFWAAFKLFLQKEFGYLIAALLSAVVDMALWCVFAGMFKFQ